MGMVRAPYHGRDGLERRINWLYGLFGIQFIVDAVILYKLFS